MWMRRAPARSAILKIEVVQLLLHVADGDYAGNVGALDIPLRSEEAHAVADEPYVRIEADRWGGDGRECGWTICVVGFIYEEACDTMTAALAALLADVAAGKTERGTHRSYYKQNPLARHETELESFRRQALEDLAHG